MKRIKILGLALGMVFALVAIAASSASANPQWWECAKVEGGKLEKGCGKEGGKGGYELKVGVGKGKAFKGKGSTVILHNVIPGKGDIKVECASLKDGGNVANGGGKGLEVGVHAEFKKCKALGAPCKTEGGKKETITTEVLAGNLGWLNKAGNVAGVALYNEAAPHTGYVAQFECEGLAKVRIHGAVIGAVAPASVFSKVTTVSYAVGPYLGELAPGYTPQVNPPAFEEEAVGVLLTELNGPETGNTWQPEGGLPSGQEGTAENKGENLLIA